MPLRSIRHLPTVSRLQAWLTADGGLSSRHLRASIFGVFIILAIAAAFLWLAHFQLIAARERAEEFAIIHIAANAENELANLEIAHRAFLQTGQPAFLAQFDRRRAIVQTCLIGLVPLVGEDAGRRENLRQIGTEFQRWLAEAALPEIAARKHARDLAALPPRIGDSALYDRIRISMSRFVRTSDDLLENVHGDLRLHRHLQTGGIVLLSVVAIGFLISSSRSSYVVFRRHLEKTEATVAQTRAIIANTLDGVITVDDRGLIESINPAAERMFEQTAERVIGQNVSLLIPQRHFSHDMRDPARGAITAVGQRRGFYPFPIEISLSAMEVARRKQFVAIVRDLTERQRSEETLRQISLGVSTATGEEFLRSLLKQLSKALQNDFVFLVELHGKTGAGDCTLTIAEAGNIRTSGSHDLTNTACAEAILKGSRIYPSGARTRFPEDTILQELAIESFLAVPLADHRGRIVGLIGMLDRTVLADTRMPESTLQIFAARAAAEIERKRSEEDLAAEKERLAVTLRSIADGFITIDNDGRVLMLNAVAERLTGWTQSEAAGHPLAEVFPLVSERTRRSCAHGLQRIVETGIAEGLSGPTLIIARDGREHMVESNSAPIRDKTNRKLGAVIVFRDVTEKQRLEEERQKADKLESLGLVAGGIAHDFNNILTSILGNLSLALITPALDETATERLVAAKKATTRAQDLAQQLLTFSKGGAPIMQTASISQLLRDTLSVTLHSANVFCDFELPDELWPVEIDPGQFSQVINNIAINADQAMPAGGSLHVQAENVELSADSASLGLRAGRWVKIAFQDQGIGIAEEYLKKIFDPYFTTKPKGSGLGLATAYSIVKNHKGVIAVVSQPGAGSVFTVCLPASQKEFRTAPADIVPIAPGSARVLVLDDEEAICMLVTCALEPLGYEVTETNDGAQAIAAYEKALGEGRRYDLVISDLTIPGGMGGQETIRRLREIDPGVRAIVSSGYANDPVMSRHEEYGFCGMIAKPWEIDALGRKIGEVLALTQRASVVFHDFEKRKTA